MGLAMIKIIWNEFRTFIRNPYLVGLLVFFPVLFVYVLGSFLEGTQVFEKNLDTIEVAYQMDEKSPLKESFERYLNQKEDSSLEKNTFHFEKAEEQIEEQTDYLMRLASNEIDLYLYFGEDEVQVYEGMDLNKNRAVASFLNGLIQSQKSMQSIMMLSPESLENVVMATGDYIQDKKMKTSMSMFDYYLVSMTILTAIFGNLATTMAFAEERQTKTIHRLLLLPKPRFSIFAGKVIGIMPQSILQIGVTFFVSIFIFDAHCGERPIDTLLVFLVLTMTAITSGAIGVLLGLVCKQFITVVVFLLDWTMLFVSGIYSIAMEVHPICDVMPAYLIKRDILRFTLFGDATGIVKIMISEIIIVAVVLIVGSVLFTMKQEEK